MALATLLIAWRFVQLVGSPEHPSQVFDNVFHLNAIRFILDTGNASSLSLASIQGVSGLDAVYPAAWHSFAALLVQLTAVDIPHRAKRPQPCDRRHRLAGLAFS